MSYPFAGKGFVNVTTAGTPVALASSSLVCWNFTIQAYKAKNVGNVGAHIYIYDNTTPTKVLLFILASGQSWSPGARGSGEYDLSTLFIDADSNGDGVLLTLQ